MVKLLVKFHSGYELHVLADPEQTLSNFIGDFETKHGKIKGLKFL